ncbi:hypothetical protein MMC17_005778 [Xylographa soralifera]|nr:hypothetical protein [Xylographa soralifera]
MSGTKPPWNLVSRFSPEWTLPMPMAFLGLRLRRHKGTRSPQVFLHELGDLRFPRGYVFEDSLFGTFYCDTQGLPEVSPFTSLLRSLCEAKYSELLLRNDGDIDGELDIDLPGFRSSGLYSKGADPGPSLVRGAVDEDSSSAEDGSCYEEEVDWNVDDENGDSFKGDSETWDPDGNAKAWNEKGQLMEEEN